MVRKILMVRGTARLLRGVPTDEKSLISSILREMNQRAGGEIPEAAVVSLLPPFVPDAGDFSLLGASLPGGGESAGSTGVGTGKSWVSYESLWLAIAMKRMQQSHTLSVGGGGGGGVPLSLSTAPHVSLSAPQTVGAFFKKLGLQVGSGLLKRLLGLLCAGESVNGAGLAEDELMDCLVFETPRMAARRRPRALDEPPIPEDADPVSVSSGDTEGWERGGKGTEPASHLHVLRTLQHLGIKF